MNIIRGTAAALTQAYSVMRSGNYGYMSFLKIVLLSSLLTSCTTLRPIDVDAETLHEKIRRGEAVETGDTIRAITIDGVAHILYVTAVDDNVVIGHPPGSELGVADTVLPIEDIVLVEVSRFSADSGRTFASGAGIGAVAVGLLFLIGIISL